MNQESQKNLEDLLRSCLIRYFFHKGDSKSKTTVTFTKNPGNYKGQSALYNDHCNHSKGIQKSTSQSLKI